MRLAECFQFRRVVLLALLTSMPGSVLASTPPEQYAPRSDWAQYLRENPSTVSPERAVATEDQVINSLDIDPGLVQSVTIEAEPDAYAVFSNLGVIQTRKGPSFLLLSTGTAGAGTGNLATPEPGTDFGRFDGDVYDRASITLEIGVPVGLTHLSFDFNFLSTEYPDFTGTEFNDAFEVILTSSQGTQNIAVDEQGRIVSVNSSDFAPANDSEAEGSGFDLFTDDPSGVDYEFGTGTPDAGLTGYQHVDATIPDGETITLELRVFDRGDGILDSAAIIDNLSISGMEIVDATPGLGMPDLTSETPDLNVIAVGGVSSSAIVADGTSRLLVRFTAPEPGQVGVSLSDDVPNALGTIRSVLGVDAGTSSNAHTFQTDVGEQAFFLYTAPETMGGEMEGSTHSRSIELTTTFTPDSGAPPNHETREISIVPVPVILVHGWNSSAVDSWGTFYDNLQSDLGMRTEAFDYKDTNHLGLDENYPGLRTKAQNLLRVLRDEGITCTQVNIVAHSMGGLIARRWASTPQFFGPETFREGYINVLLTIDTPHFGSPLADDIHAFRSRFIPPTTPEAIALIAARKTLLANFAADGSAIDDLRVRNDALTELGATEVPSFAVVGTGGTNSFAEAEGGTAWLDVLATLHVIGHPEELFGQDEHDFIVSASSQRGGLVLGPLSVFMQGGVAGQHTEATQSIGTLLTVVEKLLGGPPDVTSEGFPPVQPLAGKILLASFQDGSFDHAEISGLVGKSDGCASVLAPASGTVVQSGALVPITFEGLGAEVSAAFIIGSGGEFARIDLTNQSAQLQLREITNGRRSYSVVALRADGTLCAGDTLDLIVVPSTEVTEIRVEPQKQVLLSAGSVGQVTVSGLYSDGVLRPIGFPEAGTVFISDRPGVVEAGEEGRVFARSPGVATVVVRNGPVQSAVQVEVLDGAANQPPVADAGGPYEACTGEVLCLDATASYDPDADLEGIVLASWDLDSDGEFDDAFGINPCVLVTSNDETTIAVRVVDEMGASSNATTGVAPPTTGCECGIFDVEPPTINCPENASIEWDGIGTLDHSHPGVEAFVDAVEAVDNCDDRPEVIATLPDVLSEGVNEVLFTATDQMGNSATCVANLTIVRENGECETFSVVFGTSWDDISLQEILDAEYGPGAIDADSEYEGYACGDAEQPYWLDTSIEGWMVREVAGFRDRNVLGWHIEDFTHPVIDGDGDGVIFAGSSGEGQTTVVTFPDGETRFGFYLNPNGELDTPNAPEPEMFFTNRRYNDAGADGLGDSREPDGGDPQCLIYNISELRGGTPTFVLAWEDIDYGSPMTTTYAVDGTDNDFQDLVVEFEALSPVPTVSVRLALQTDDEAGVLRWTIDGADMIDRLSLCRRSLSGFERHLAEWRDSEIEPDGHWPIDSDEGGFGIYRLDGYAGGVRVASEEVPISRPPASQHYLGNAAPNPFNPTTEISFVLAGPERVELSIYDVAGRLVRVLARGEMSPGAHTLRWDGEDQSGRRAGSGVYLYRLEAGKYRETKRMVLLK